MYCIGGGGGGPESRNGLSVNEQGGFIQGGLIFRGL